MNWKNKAALCALLAAVALGTLVTAIAGGEGEMIPALSEPAEISGQDTQEQDGHEPEAEKSFALRPLEGRVAVYLAGERTPLLITDIELKNLRELDRKLIESGFTVEGRERLMELLEDLGS